VGARILLVRKSASDNLRAGHRHNPTLLLSPYHSPPLCYTVTCATNAVDFCKQFEAPKSISSCWSKEQEKGE
jgi:hypothetical protein